MKEWELVKNLLGIGGLPNTPQGVLLNAKKGNWQRRRVAGVKGNVFEYYIGDMPLAVRQALGFSEPLTKALDKPMERSQDDLQKRIDQLENKLQALETKAQGFVSPKPPEGLTNDEWQLVCAFRRCNEDRKVGLLATAEALAAQTEKEQKESLAALEVRAVA
ncbi:DNA-binding protein [Avibacterium paragallinarum]|uniref:Ci repressor-like protein n=3 Tax=Avibacterium paragallinarum TaxID=728 RepID=A0A377I7B5_AVIPA|nr:DNA-binding protein [Avibacterium paragallinarum]RZN75098.1 ci repressor-like protein [Avibacterium paragallinarum]STO71071.1 ci repressor-like protein [Avibacterium paragallinarum]